MTKTTPRARYTLEFKQEAVRLVDGGQTIAAAARTLGLVDQTLFNWVKVHRAGKLTGAGSQVVSAQPNASDSGHLMKMLGKAQHRMSALRSDGQDTAQCRQVVNLQPCGGLHRNRRKLVQGWRGRGDVQSQSLRWNK